MTRRQYENMKLKEMIFAKMCECGDKRKTSEWHKICDNDGKMTLNNFSKLMRELEADGIVGHLTSKGSLYYFVS